MALYGVMRVEKRKRTSISALQKEANRTEDTHAAGKDFLRSDINWERTQYNHYFRKCENWNTTISDIIKSHGLKERKDSVVMLDGIYTASRDFFKDKTGKEVGDFFRACLDEHVKLYCGGDKSLVINAVLHLDETTPHVHVASVPIKLDENGKAHLSARDIMGNRTDMRAKQDLMYDDVFKGYGFERGDLNRDEVIKEHKTKREYEIAKLDQEFEDKKKDLDDISVKVFQEQRQLSKYNRLKREAEEAEKIIKSLEYASKDDINVGVMALKVFEAAGGDKSTLVKEFAKIAQNVIDNATISKDDDLIK